MPTPTPRRALRPASQRSSTLVSIYMLLGVGSVAPGWGLQHCMVEVCVCAEGGEEAYRISLLLLGRTVTTCHGVGALGVAVAAPRAAERIAPVRISIISPGLFVIVRVPSCT